MPFTMENAETLGEHASAFVQKECNQWISREWDEKCVYPKHVFDKLAQLGWMGIGIPEADGGSGGGATELIVLCEELGRGSTGLVACLSLTASGMRTLIAHGTEEQRATLIPQLMDGTKRLSISISEPDSDSASLTATAVRRDESTFVARGQKTWCEAAGHPGTLIQLFVRTNPDVPKHQGISMFLLDPATPGVDLRRLPTLGRNSTDWYAPYNTYRCGDGKVIQLACHNDKFFERIAEAIGQPALAEDPRFATNDARLDNRDALDEIIAAFCSTMPRDEVLEHLWKFDAMVGPVNTYAEVFRDTQVLHNEMVVSFDGPDGEVRTSGVPLRFSRTPGAVRRPPPACGEHTVEILAELGITS